MGGKALDLRGKCDACFWWNPQDDRKVSGACTRFPPTATVLAVPVMTVGMREPQIQFQTHTGWPLTRAEAGCGEWKGKVQLANG